MKKFNYLYNPLSEAYNPPEGKEVKPLSIEQLKSGMVEAIQTSQLRLYQEYTIALVDSLLERIEKLESGKTAQAPKKAGKESSEA